MLKRPISEATKQNSLAKIVGRRIKTSAQGLLNEIEFAYPTRDDRYIDEVILNSPQGKLLRFGVAIRYKESQLSGNEWRTSAFAEYFKSKDDGPEILFGNAHRVDDAIAKLSLELSFGDERTRGIRGRECIGFTAYRKGAKVFEDTFPMKHLLINTMAALPWLLVIKGETTIFDETAHDATKCFQYGCAGQAKKKGKLKKMYCDHGEPHDPMFLNYRSFCETHFNRGDFDMEDADDNYEFSEL